MKKILSLMMLLVAIVTGAKADETVFSASAAATSTQKWTGSADGTTTELTAAQATVTGGKMYVVTYQTSSKELMKKNSNVMCFCMTNNNTYFKISLNEVLQVGDKISATYYGGEKDGNAKGIAISSTSDGANAVTDVDCKATSTSTEAQTLTYTVTAGDAYVGKTDLFIYRMAGATQYFSDITITRASATTAPVITTDLAATADVTVGVAEDFSIVATGATSYQWYKDDVAIEGATAATYSYTAAAAGTVNIKCVASNTYGDTPSTVCAVTATAPANPPVITTNLEAAYNVIKGQTQELSIVAEDASSYQWYLDGVAVEDAITDTYTFKAGSTIGATNEVYCAATNAAGTTNSATATITTVGRADCEVTNIKFSNGAYGAINNATYGDGTIAVPYIAGTSAPTVETSSIVVSDGATYVLDGNTLTVTAEDETTSKEFTINAVEITPLTVSADVAVTSFTEVPSWVFNLYGWDSTKGLKFAKKVDEASNMRIAKGNTRQYYFIGAAKSLTLTKVGSTRKVNVYVNGTKVISDTNNDALGAITLDETAPCMVMIESNQTGGDGGFSAYAIEAAVPTTETITVGETGFATIGLPFATTVPAGVTAYAVESVAGSKVTTSAAIAAGTTIPANQGFIITAAPNTYTFTEVAEGEYTGTNILAAVGATAKVATAEAPIFVFAKLSDSKVGFKKATSGSLGAYKAYLPGDVSDQQSLTISFDGEATAVDAIAEADEAEAAPVKVIKNGKLYIGNFNVAGQQVK